MAYEDLLIHTCEVRRRTGSLDRFKQPVEPSLADQPAATYPCRLTTPRGSEQFQERARDTIGEQFTLFLSNDATLSESDLVTVRDQAGGLLLELGNVTHVKRPLDAIGYHHVEADVSTVRSGEDVRPG